MSAYLIVERTLWHDLRDEYSLHDVAEIGITPDWQVWAKPDPDACTCGNCVLRSLGFRGGPEVFVLELW